MSLPIINKQVIRFNKGQCLSYLGNAYTALAVLLLLCIIFRPEFRNVLSYFVISRQVTCVGIIAIGMTFVIAGGGIDLSVGSLFAFSGVCAVLSLDFFTAHPNLLPPAFVSSTFGAFLIMAVTSLLTGLVGGFLNGILTVYCKIPPFIATLGTLSIFRSLALHLADSGVLQPQVNITEISDPYVGRYPLAFLAFLALVAVFSVVLNNTAFGRHVCAVGANEKVAAFSGIYTKEVKLLTYIITGGCVGFAMILFIGQFNAVPNDAGNLYELDAIAAVVIGGTAMSGGKGSVWGTLAGALILGIIFALLNFAGTASTLKDLVKGIIILISVLIQMISVLIQRKEQA